MRERWQDDRVLSRRLRILRMDILVIEEMLTSREFRYQLDLPADASIVNMRTDDSGLYLLFLVHSDTFDPVPPAERPPDLAAAVTVSRIDY